MLKLYAVSELISVILALKLMVGKTHYPRTQGKCDSQLATINLPQVSLGTHLWTSLRRERENTQLGGLAQAPIRVCIHLGVHSII